MSDEIQAPNGGEGTHIPGEVTPLVQEALDQGWVPKEEFQGDLERWVDAGEFVRRGELFRKIESQSKELKDVKKALAALAKHNSQIAATEYERALKELRAQKKDALAEGDAERVVDVEDKIDLIKDQQKWHAQQQAKEIQEQTVNPEFARWTERNSWYETDRRMRIHADDYGVELAKQGMSPVEVLAEVEKEIKRAYPEKFRNPNRAKAGAVEGTVARPNTGKRDDGADMNDAQKRIMDTIVKTGVMTKEEYIKQFKAINAKG